MLNFFWEIKENARDKKETEKKLQDLRGKLFRSPFFSSLETKKVNLIFCDTHRIKELNRLYRKISTATDVLSFSESDLKDKDCFLREKDLLGEIFINYDWLKKGKAQGLVGLRELFVHGVLHLIGFDHEKDNGEMRMIEKKFAKKRKS